MRRPTLVFITNVDWAFVSHRLPIALEAINKGYDIHLISKGTEYQAFLKNKGIFFHNWNLHRSSINPFLIIFDIWKLYAILIKIKPDIIHAITIKPILMCGILKFFLRKVAFVYAIAGLGYAFTSKSLKSLCIKFLSIIFFKLAFTMSQSHVIFQNNEDLKKILKICKLKKERFTLIPGSGVDLKEYKPIYPGQSLNKPIVLFASRLLKSKGLFEFINAAQHIRSAEFHIAGKFDNGNDDCVQKNQIDDFVKKGFIKYLGMQNDMVSLINKATMVVLPSYYGEGIPKILIEAAACAKPIITTNHPGCRDAVLNNVSGILIPPRNSKELKKAIIYLLENPKLRSKMSKEARILAIQKFNINDVIATHISIYKKLLKK